MEFTTKLKYSNSKKFTKDNNTYFTAVFLDEQDFRYSFYIKEDLYNKLQTKKHYEEVELRLSLYESPNNGRYGLQCL